MNILKPYNSKAILANIELVLKTGDSTKLNKPTYNFINLMSGFIAHYDLYGFQSVYGDVSTLANELWQSVKSYTPDIVYETASYGGDYAASKQEIYKAIPALVEKYADKLNKTTADSATKALENLVAIVNKVLSQKDPELNRKTCQELDINY